MNAASIGETIKTYSKHGWILRRVLLTPKLRRELGADADTLFDSVKVSEGDIDAALFSRPPSKEETAWEIRHLSQKPFAVLDYFDETSPDFEHKLRNLAARLAATISAKRKA